LNNPEYGHIIKETFDVKFVDVLMVSDIRDELFDGSDGTYLWHVCVIELFQFIF